MSRFFVLLLTAAITGLAQPPESPKFDVATVKPNTDNDNRFMIRPGPGGVLSITGVPLRMLIMEAYDRRAFQVSGGPGWMNTERWDIQAKSEGVRGQFPLEKWRAMLQALIEERFHLEMHHEPKEMVVYELVVGKNGSKLAPHTGDPTAPAERFRMRPGLFSFKQARISGLAYQLTLVLGRQVTDKTALTGEYDITLEFTPEPGQGGPEAIGLPTQVTPQVPSGVDPNGPSIFTALEEQLGLRLQAGKGPVDVIVVDRAEKPAEN